MGGKLTQVPTTPELVEKLRDQRHVVQGDGLAALLATTSEAADALEAQKARIAELEVERDDLQRMYRHWAMIADQRLGASNRSLHRARDLQALADRYEKALRPFAAAFDAFSYDEPIIDLDQYRAMHESVCLNDFRQASLAISSSHGSKK